MKCKFLQFHENYRPAYYGTWRQRSKAINPRNYLQKDEDLLDYEIDSDDEWEEPGESLSHSEVNSFYSEQTYEANKCQYFVLYFILYYLVFNDRESHISRDR